MMDIKQWFKDYLKVNVPCQTNGTDGALRAAIDLYKATGDEELRQFVLEHGVCPAAHLYQEPFFVWEQTGEKNDRQAIELCMQELCGADVPVDGKTLYAAGPFRMAYEMKCGGMEKVAAVVQMFKAVHQCSARPDGWQLMALMDAIAWCREELYEHYRALIDMFRVELPVVLSCGKAEDQALVACALMKAVRLGVVNPEKYLPIGKQMFMALDLPGEGEPVGPFIMAYSEFLLAE